jgi:UDP-2,4-diacetamido-2,4,6-trideoxy-beta-L-altropyranose hydrolase
MNIVIRLDTGSIIGLGHYVRCVNMCSYFDNPTITFITKPHIGNVIHKMKAQYNVIVLEMGTDDMTWLGESQEKDAEKTICAIKNMNKIDLFIVDHYAINEIWEKMIYKYCKSLFVIDDNINQKHYCDFLLDVCRHEKIKNSVPLCIQFIGTQYSLINKAILSMEIKQSTEIKRVNIFLGGGDSTNETMKILKILDNKFTNIMFDVIVGTSNQHYDEIKEFCKNKIQYTVYYDLANINFLHVLNKADLCIGGSGMTTFERCLLKKPSIVILTADNQIDIFNKTQLCHVSMNIGKYNTDYASKLLTVMDLCINNWHFTQNMIRKCSRIITKDNLNNIQTTINTKSKLAINGGCKTRETMLSYGKQSIDNDDISSVMTIFLQNTYLTTGPKVNEFENAICNYSGYKYGVAVNSGGAALHIACHAIGIQKGDEVIVTCMSFVATSNAILYCGGTPIFCDIESDTMNIDSDKIEALITDKTKAIITVDFAGQLCNYEKINKIAKQYNLFVIQDAAHAISDKVTSSNSDIIIFSFHPVKHLTTCEGGMSITNNELFYNKMKQFRTYGINRSSQDRESHAEHYYEMHELGFNYRLPDVLCALGISQLKNLDKWILRRQFIAKLYDDYFTEQLSDYIIPLTNKFYNVYHIYIIKLKSNVVPRDIIFKALKAENIGVNVHYLPIPMHPYYQKNMTINPSSYSIAKSVYEQIITLPLYPTMTDDDVYDVMFAVKRVLNFYY